MPINFMASSSSAQPRHDDTAFVVFVSAAILLTAPTLPAQTPLNTRTLNGSGADTRRADRKYANRGR